MMKCHICHHTAEPLFKTRLLNKYDVQYFKCNTCGFIQTETPYWFEEAYKSAITSLDIGLIGRNLYLNDQVSRIIDICFPESRIMVDYGGGYGMFVRMMRDKGYNFYRQDLYCENLFAAYFDLPDAPAATFDVLTSFEVFEHLQDPLAEIEKMFRLSGTIIFTTLLLPTDQKDLKDWWYISPLTGQHIAFYDQRTLAYLAQKFGKNLYTNGNNLHILTDKLLSSALVAEALGTQDHSFLSRLKRKLTGKSTPTVSRASLLPADYKFIEEKLRNS
jgi:2-polyprenyl-3-methyl-5-hydroxy-6-metoxy-1,4-benzoquinol methylase